MTTQEKVNLIRHLNNCLSNVMLAKKLSEDLNLVLISGYLNTIEKDLNSLGAEIRLIDL
jgi:hypothetical protein